MLIKKLKAEKSGLQVAIDNVLSEMQGFTADSDEYERMVDQLVKLQALKDCERPDRVTKDTLAIIAANLFGIVMIVGYERTNVMTSKAVSFLFKLR
jgi:hypothetical protein